MRTRQRLSRLEHRLNDVEVKIMNPPRNKDEGFQVATRAIENFDLIEEIFTLKSTIEAQKAANNLQREANEKQAKEIKGLRLNIELLTEVEKLKDVIGDAEKEAKEPKIGSAVKCWDKEGDIKRLGVYLGKIECEKYPYKCGIGVNNVAFKHIEAYEV